MRKILTLCLAFVLLLTFISSSASADPIYEDSKAPALDVVKNQLIMESARISDMGMEAAKEMLLLAFFENVTEADVVKAVEDCMTENGSSEYVEAFGVLVASGEQSALPHGDTSDDATNLILPGEVVVVDLGARYRGYCSDLTRTFFMGNATQNMTEIYNITLEAQEAAIRAVQSGVMASDVDAVARDIISGYGYGDNFIHALGHGIALYIHMPPTLSPSSNEVLFESGDMTITIEPGIYLEGEFGVRIEDDVFVERTGQSLLTHFPKDLESAILLPSDYRNKTTDSKMQNNDDFGGGSIIVPLIAIVVALIIIYMVIRIRGKKHQRDHAYETKESPNTPSPP
jgi:methionine aminopeptidase